MTASTTLPPALRKGHWFLSASGIQFYPLDPRPQDINLYDIAHALSNVCRFGGHCQTFYSVAQHSVHVSQLLERMGEPTETVLQGLLHDATEAYVGDMVRPLKVSMPDYRAVEIALWQVIAKRFRVRPKFAPNVKRCDDIALMTERRDIVIPTPHRWSVLAEPDEQTITPLAPGEARQAFMQRYFALDAMRRGA